MKIELLNNQNIEDRIRVIAAAGKLSRTKGDVFDVLESCDVYEKNLGLVKRILEMGHKTIIEHDYYVFALANVSPIIEQTLISHRFTSFTIKSGRMVDFRNVGYYIPSFKDKNYKLVPNQDSLVKDYHSHMQTLFKEYGYFVDKGVKEEDARFVLPYSFNTNIIMGLDARELELMLNEFLYGKLSNIDEIKELGTKLLDIVKSDISYLEEYVNGEQHTKDDWYDKYRIGNDIVTYDKARLVDYTPNVDENIIITTIMYHEQVTREKAYELLNDMLKNNPNIIDDIMQDIVKSKQQRELEAVSFKFEVPISLIILKHFTRHRTQSLLVPDFVPMWNLENYQTPPSIKRLDEERYKEIFKLNNETYKKFRDLGVRDEDLIYFYLCGNFANVTTIMDGRTLEWISRMRCCTKAQWEIRNLLNDMVSQVREIAPSYGKTLGATCDVYGYCPEGKESCGKVKCKEK